MLANLKLYAAAIGIGAAIIVIWSGTVWVHGYRTASNACEAEALRSEIATLKADLRIRARAEAFAREEAARLSLDAQERQEQIDELATQLESLPAGDVCRATRDDVDWLRRIHPRPRPIAPAGSG